MTKWKTLQHNGILFPPAYESQGIKDKDQRRKSRSQFRPRRDDLPMGKKERHPICPRQSFSKKLYSRFCKTLDSKFKKISYEDIDFSDVYKLVDKEKDLKEMMTKEEKRQQAKKRKELREELKAKYGIAIMDGKEVEVGNYMAEPPGIFIGRGEHPLRGRWKPRVTKEDVTLNLGKEAKVPEGKWGKIIHDKDSMWLASWMDFLTQKKKVCLACR